MPALQKHHRKQRAGVRKLSPESDLQLIKVLFLFDALNVTAEMNCQHAENHNSDKT